MRKVILGKTNIEANCQSFGALPIQRPEEKEAIKVLQAAYEGGMNFFDTARAYTNSEERIGKAFTPSMRDNIYLATKSMGKNKQQILDDIETSLKFLKTDCVDLFQAHNIPTILDENDENGIHAGLVEAQRRGYCKYIGITTHRLKVAEGSVDKGLYDTLQFPLSYLSSAEDLALVERVKTQNMGIIAMKALAGGAVASAKGAAAFMETLPNLLPIWGIQSMKELEEFLSYGENPPKLEGELLDIINNDKYELGNHFCRSCGYCMPCTAAPELEMHVAMRMKLNLTRMPQEQFLNDKWQKQMVLIEKCIDCGVCKKRCPYGLDCPTVLRENLVYYRMVCEQNGITLG